MFHKPRIAKGLSLIVLTLVILAPSAAAEAAEAPGGLVDRVDSWLTELWEVFDFLSVSTSSETGETSQTQSTPPPLGASTQADDDCGTDATPGATDCDPNAVPIVDPRG